MGAPITKKYNAVIFLIRIFIVGSVVLAFHILQLFLFFLPRWEFEYSNQVKYSIGGRIAYAISPTLPTIPVSTLLFFYLLWKVTASRKYEPALWIAVMLMVYCWIVVGGCAIGFGSAFNSMSGYEHRGPWNIAFSIIELLILFGACVIAHKRAGLISPTNHNRGTDKL